MQLVEVIHVLYMKVDRENWQMNLNAVYIYETCAAQGRRNVSKSGEAQVFQDHMLHRLRF